MSNTISPAVVIIILICLINAGATLALWKAADNVGDNAQTSADTAQKAADAALKVANNNERLIKLRVDQSCTIEEGQKDTAPAYCDEPGVGLP